MRTPFSTKFNYSPGETTQSPNQVLNPVKCSGSLGDCKEGRREDWIPGRTLIAYVSNTNHISRDIVLLGHNKV